MPINLPLSKVIKPQAGWYRGDFHAHTHFSDGYYSPPDLVEVARTEGLEFFAITDHNTLEAYPHFGDLSDILVIPGIEVTAKAGHFNVFGIQHRPDWIVSATWPDLSDPYNTMTKLMRQITSEGLLNSINHPFLKPWEWRDQAADLRYVQCLEIWNDPSWPDNKQANPQAVAMWTAWLNAGYRITAIGGSDYHRPLPPPGQNKPPDRLGLPGSYVYAESLSGAAILAGLRQRRVYVSLGPRVSFQARANGKIYNIGADLGEMKGVVEFEGDVSYQAGPAYIQLVKNGLVIAETLLVEGQGRLRYGDPVAPNQAAWYRLDVLDPYQQILAVTNPIFVGPKAEPTQWLYGDFNNGQN